MPPAVQLAMEYCVDGLADAIAPLLPEPPPSTRSQASGVSCQWSVVSCEDHDSHHSLQLTTDH